jgi:AcrR family transcriptional regulator
MEAASLLAVAKGWDKLRMGMVAAAVGISRPTLYKQFGDKQGLAQAVLMREVARFLTGVRKALAAHDDDPERAITAAVRSALTDGDTNPLLRMILTPGPGGHTDLLRLLTSEGNPVLRAIEGAVGDWAVRHFPDAPPESVHLAVDAVARMALSYLVLPPADPERAAATVARMAVRYLRP